MRDTKIHVSYAEVQIKKKTGGSMFKLSPSFLNNKLRALVEWIRDEEFYKFHVQLDAIRCLNHTVLCACLLCCLEVEDQHSQWATLEIKEFGLGSLVSAGLVVHKRCTLVDFVFFARLVVHK